jgi:hypothetical protein
MTSATIDTPETDTHAGACIRSFEACRQASHLSHEARMLKSAAADAVEDGVYEVVHRVKRQPLRSLGIALGAGIVLGAAVGWIGRGPGRHE